MSSQIDRAIALSKIVGKITGPMVTVDAQPPPPVTDFAPQIVQVPLVQGYPIVGTTLATSTGIWAASPAPFFQYQWYADGSPIAAATGSTFVLDVPQIGATITVSVVATNTAGASTSTSQGYGPVQAAKAGPPTWWITPTGAGTKAGNNLTNAGSLTELNAIIAGAAADDVVGFVSDLGNYSISALTQLSHGGTAGHPIVLRGVTSAGAAAYAVMFGTRANPWTMGAAAGVECFRLVSGANNLTFEYFDFQNIGNGCVRVSADISNLTIQFCTAENFQRFLENTFSSPATTATITGFTIRNVAGIGYSKSAIHIRYASTTGLIEDCDMDSNFQDGDNFSTGFKLEDTASNITFLRCQARNIVDIILGHTYYNGDAFADEVGNANITFDACTAGPYVTDGGYDCKGPANIYTNCVAMGCKRNWRVWGGSTLLNCTGIDPHYPGGTGTSPTQVWISDTVSPAAVVNGCSFVDQGTNTIVFDQEALGSDLTVTNTAVQTGPGSTVVNNPGGAASSVSTRAAPTNVSPPAITGLAQSGHSLTVTQGSWLGNIARSWQWKRNSLFIEDATQQSYLLADADVGQNVEVSEYATNSDGDVGESTSIPVFPITGVAPSIISLPTIVGFTISGQTLTGSPGSWSGSPYPTFTYRWLANGVAIGGATAATYLLTNTEIGKTIRFEVTANNSAGGPSVATSLSTAAIVASTALTVFVRPISHGTGDGSSWANAMTLSGLTAVNWTPGSLTHLRGDEGNHTAATVTIASAGTGGSPIVFRGVDVNLSPMIANIKGTRGPSSPEWTYTPTTVPITDSQGNNVNIPRPTAATSVKGWAVGQNIFSLADGAAYITFENIGFERVGQPFTIASGTVDHLTLTNIDCFNTREGVFMASKTLTNLTVTTYRMRGFSKKGFRFEGASANWVIKDIHLDSAWQDGDDFANGFAGDKTSGGPAHDLTVWGTMPGGTYDGFIGNCYMSNGSGYWNGDGAAFENNNFNILFQDCIFAGSTDAGIDSKAANTTVLRCTSIYNKRNYKCWYGPYVILNSLTQDPCLAGAPGNSGGGSGGPAHFTTLNVDLQVKDSTALDTLGAHGVWISDSTVPFEDVIVRLVDATFTGTASTAAISGQLQIACADNTTAPVISAATSGTIFKNQSALIALTADKGCSWQIVGGLDQVQYLVTDSSGAAKKAGQFLHIGPQTYTVGGYNDRVVNVQAEDANGNITTFTYTTTILAGAPPYTMQCLFEGANGATTCLTEDGRTVTMSGGAKLTTSAPLQGVSSYLGVTGGLAAIDDSPDWHFTGGFSLLALINSTSFAAAQDVMSQYSPSSGLRSWRLSVSATGALQFIWSADGNATATISSAAGIVTAGTHEVAVDRDASNNIRLYVDGVMVVKAVVSSAFRDSSTSLRIGNINGGTSSFIGKIDNTRIWKGYFFCGSDNGYTP